MEIIMITGAVNSGKSRAMLKFLKKEKINAQNTTGIISIGIFENNEKTGFSVIDVCTMRSEILARVNPQKRTRLKVGKYFFYQKGLDFAKKALIRSNPNGIVFIDEIGYLEKNDKGYSEQLKEILNSNVKRIYVVIRKDHLKSLKTKFFSRKEIKKISVINI